MLLDKMKCFAPPARRGRTCLPCTVQTRTNRGHCNTLHASLLTSTAVLFCKASPLVLSSSPCRKKELRRGLQRCVRALTFNIMETNDLNARPPLPLTPRHLGFLLHQKTLHFVKERLFCFAAACNGLKIKAQSTSSKTTSLYSLSESVSSIYGQKPLQDHQG